MRTPFDETGIVFAWNEAGTIGLALEGEALVDHGEGTEAVIALYERCGLPALAELNGYFCGLLVDRQKREYVLFNDRYGLGRVYLHETPDGVRFATRASDLLEKLSDTRALDPSGLAEWLTCGCALENRTLFAGISLLPPGSAWRFTADRIVARDRYFDPKSWVSQPALPASEYYRHLREVFPRALRRSMRGKRKIAMSLTGGLDSRMIMAWLPCGPGQLPCYTFNGLLRDCADVRIARRVAQLCGQQHQTIPIKEKFFSEFPSLAEQTILATDGAMEVTGAAELYANRFAREIAPVRLTGNYGSEILRSNVAFRPRPVSGEIFSPETLRLCTGARETYRREADGNRLGFIAFKQVPWHHFARFAAERSQVAMRSPFLDNELVALAFRAPVEMARSAELALRLVSEGNPALGEIPTDRGLAFKHGQPVNGIRHSFEEFLVKAEYAYDYGMPHWLARVDHYLAPLKLERLFLGRQKFCHFRSWYRGPLAGYVREVLLDPAVVGRPWVNRAALEPMVNAHVRGTRNYTLEIHKLLSLELVQRLLLK